MKKIGVRLAVVAALIFLGVSFVGAQGTDAEGWARIQRSA